jgi:2-amino-4-hydroxy-6-hydroxymethyldihydropteridine diphosphokinase
MVVPGIEAVNSRLKPPAGAWAVVAIGSNLGDRAAWLDFARERLRVGGFPWTVASSVVETAPVGGPAGQGPFLNQVVAAPLDARTAGPRQLLEIALAIERDAGRVRVERWGPRTLDLDIVLYGDTVLDEPGLTIPHPRMAERPFVLGPLAEILPAVLHPVLRKSIAELAAAFAGGACPDEPPPRRMPPTRGHR